jgi:hypothetical protein
LLSKLVHEIDDQWDCLDILQSALLNAKESKIFLMAVKALYDHDVIEEEVILEWYDQPDGVPGVKLLKDAVRIQCPFHRVDFSVCGLVKMCRRRRRK